MKQFKYINRERGIRPTAVGALARKNLPLAAFLTLALLIPLSHAKIKEISKRISLLFGGERGIRTLETR